MTFFSQFLFVCETILWVLLLAFLIRGPYRKYLVFFTYALAGLAGDLVESFGYYRWGLQSPDYRQLYWTVNIALDLFLFWVVISFIYSALPDNRLRSRAARALGVIAVAALALPFAILPAHYSPSHGHFTSQYFNHVSQILSFAAAAMNLVLWGALLLDRRRDKQLVSLSIGLGVLTATEAIAWGARRWLAPENRGLMDAFMLIARIMSLLIWCWVFRPKSQEPTSIAPPDALTAS